MRLRFFSLGIVFALAMIVVPGCGGDNEKKAQPANTESTETPSTNGSGEGAARTLLYPYEKAVQQFLVEAGKGNNQGAFALITPAAQKAYSETKTDFEAQLFQGTVNRITGSDPLQEGNDEYFGVYVDITATEMDPPLQFETVWGVRKIGTEFRIANIMVNLDESAEEVLHLNFEDPVGTRLALTGPSESPQQVPPAGATQIATMPPYAGQAPQMQTFPMQNQNMPSQTPQFQSTEFQQAQPQMAQPTMQNYQ